MRKKPLVLFFFLLVALCYVHQTHFDSGTPVSRLDLLHSLVVYRTVEIDAYHENTSDKAKWNDHFYSDKAPGTVVLALPAFATTAQVLRVAGADLNSKSGWLATSWAACAFSQALLAVLGAVAMFVWLGRFVSQRAALVTVLGVFLGGMPLPYCTVLFSHAQVVGLLGMAVWAVELFVPEAAFCSRGWTMAGAGFCVGLALVSEYTAGLVALALAFYVVLRRREGMWAFAIGAIPPLLLIPAYNWACFGDVFTLPYSRQASFPEMKNGLYAIEWPDLETAYNLLFSPTRGLFFWSPFLVMAGFGYRKLMERCRGLFWLTYAVPLLQIVVISGRTWDWEAGPTLGPRYLAPILPLLALPCALGAQRFRKLGMLLATYSIGITTLATLTDACPSGSIYSPLFELHVPRLLKGEFSPNLGMVIGLPPYLSIALFYAILVAGIWWLWIRLPSETIVRDATNSSR